MDQQQERFLYLIQEVGQQAQSKPSVLIGVLDASGSMSSYWPTLAIQYNKLKQLCGFADTITFDSRAYQKQNAEIDTNINNNGGGGTDITQAILALNKTLQKYVDVPVTVIFVSDGEGNTVGIDKIMPPPMKFINFICVGVGQGFPTFISMQLRQQFHKGDTNVPPLFLVHNEGWQQNFVTQFEMLSQYIYVKDPQKTSPCYEFPWDKETKQSFYPGQWVQSDQQIININGENVYPTQMDMSKILDLARYWLQNVQVKSLKQDATADAQIAYEELNRLKSQFEVAKKKLTFAQRIQQNKIYEPLTVILRELKELGKQNFLRNLPPEEAAKRLAMGTQIGTFHNKAVNIRGLTVEQYLKDRDDFIKIVSTIQLEPSESERSVILLQNQKQVFMENDIVAGLQLCQSQYDLVTQLPVIGYGIFVKRFNGSMINPWLIEVTQMAKHHKYIDSLAVFNGENHLKLKIGDGEIENINCICPLYTEKDKDLAPLLQSRLFHILMTFNVMQNADTCFDTAYAAVLANSLLFLINQPDSQWKAELIELIRQTYSITYAGKYNFYKNELIEKPATSLVTEHPNIKTKCEDPSKAILVLEMAKKDLQPDQIKEIAERIIIETVGRFNDKKIEDYYIVKNVDNELVNQVFEKIENDIIKIIPQNLLAAFYTEQELKDFIVKQFEEAKKTIKFDVQIALNEEAILKFGHSKYNYQSLQRIYEYFVGEEFTLEFLTAALNHACRFTASVDRSTNPISLNLAEPEELIRRKKHQELIQTNNIVQNVFNRVRPNLIEAFAKSHSAVVPPNLNNIKQIIQEQDLVAKCGVKLSDLLKNICLAADCPHYLSYRPQLNQHLAIKPPIQGFFKAIKCSLDKSNEEILEIIKSGSVLRNGLKLSQVQIDELNNQREEYLEIIDRIKKETLKIQQQ